LFATHFFELTELPKTLKNVKNVHVSAKEHEDTIAFLHTVTEGPASRSYGLQVALLAGVPTEVIQTAKQKLLALEKTGVKQAPIKRTSKQTPNKLQQQFAKINPDSLTPKQALDVIYQLKKIFEEDLVTNE